MGCAEMEFPIQNFYEKQTEKETGTNTSKYAIYPSSNQYSTLFQRVCTELPYLNWW